MSPSPTNKSQGGAVQGAAGSLRKGSVTSLGTDSGHWGLIQRPCLPPMLSSFSGCQELLWLRGSAGWCSVWQWRWACRECRVLAESRTTPHPGLTLCLLSERAGAGFQTERENLTQGAEVLEFFHHFSPLKCWQSCVRKHQLEVWIRRVKAL